MLTNQLLRRFFPIWFRDGLLLGPVAASILQGLSPASIAILSIVAQRLSTRIGMRFGAIAPSRYDECSLPTALAGAHFHWPLR